MSERNDPQADERDEDRTPSVSNPFAEGDGPGDGEPQINLSKRRAATLGFGFGLVMVGLLVVCFLVSVALASCTG